MELTAYSKLHGLFFRAECGDSSPIQFKFQSIILVVASHGGVFGFVVSQDLMMARHAKVGATLVAD